MNNLSQFLAVFEGYIKSEEGSTQIIIEVIQDVVGVTLKPDQINQGEFGLFLDSHPVIKNEIFLKKEKLLEVLKKKTGRSFDSVI
jgi:hypothetical protein